MVRALFLALLLLAAPAFAGPFTPPIDALRDAIAERTQRVEEFRFIREEAGKRGVRAYLFGGTAAAYAHYVKWDLERAAGDGRYQPDRFDYDYTNIYRSTQDLDIVIDGTPEQADEIRAELGKKFPHLQGSKNAWEVRLLRQDVGDKLAILNNPDFLNQHSDSNSTGMVEITKPAPGESPVRDVMDWESKEPHFLRDVHDGKLHYYFNPRHGTTKFAKEGRNPPILSAIRYLTKAFQFELELRDEDMARVRKIVNEFDPKGPELQNDYVKNWLLNKENGRKLMQNAVNMEYAARVLDDLGLRKKLVAIENDADKIGTLAWWMNRKPLPSAPLGKGRGKTAAELGIDTVAHETQGFLAYESITKAHTGDPNVFTSRESAAGEAALHGEGFYTQEGLKGARGTGFTIRFKVNPAAREGTDFILADGGGGEGKAYVIFKNRNAFKVIPQSLDWTHLDYYRWLDAGNTPSNDDKGIFEKLKRRLSTKKISAEEHAEMHAIVSRSLASGKDNRPLIDQWLQEALSPAELEEVFDHLLKHPALWLSNYPASDVDRYKAFFERLGKDRHLERSDANWAARVEDSLHSPGPNRPMAVAWAIHDPDGLRATKIMNTMSSGSFADVPPARQVDVKQNLFGLYFQRAPHRDGFSKILENLLQHHSGGTVVNILSAAGGLHEGNPFRAVAEPFFPELLAKLVSENNVSHFVFKEIANHPERYSAQLVNDYFLAQSGGMHTEESLLFEKGLFKDLPARRARLRALVEAELGARAKNIQSPMSFAALAHWFRDYPGDSEFKATFEDWVRRSHEQAVKNPSAENPRANLSKLLEAAPELYPLELQEEAIRNGVNGPGKFFEQYILRYWNEAAKAGRPLTPGQVQAAAAFATRAFAKWEHGDLPNNLAYAMNLLNPAEHPAIWKTFGERVQDDLSEIGDSSAGRYSYFDAWLKSDHGKVDTTPLDFLAREERYGPLFRQLLVNREDDWLTHPKVLEIFRQVTARPYHRGLTDSATTIREIYEKNRFLWSLAETERYLDFLLEQAEVERRLHETYLVFQDAMARRSPNVIKRMSRYLDTDFRYPNGVTNPGVSIVQYFSYYPELNKREGVEEVFDKALLFMLKRDKDDREYSFAALKKVLSTPDWKDHPRTKLWLDIMEGRESAMKLRETARLGERCAGFFRDLLRP